MEKLTVQITGELISFSESSFTAKSDGQEVNFAFVLLRVDGALYRFGVPYSEARLRDDLRLAIDDEVTLVLGFSPSAERASTCKVVGMV